MAFINLLHNGYQGKLGETVGQKWKNQRTVRTYNPHNPSKSEAQLDQRAHYKTLIQQSSKWYPSTFNLIVPKNKRMNKFNFFTSSLESVIENVDANNFQFSLGDYKAKNVLNPWGGTKNGEVWAYILLPYGDPPKSVDSIPQSVILGLNGNRDIVAMPNGILANEIIPKKPKDGATPYPFPRGYFVKTNIDGNSRDLILFSVGRKERGAIKWSEVTMISPVFHIVDDQLEDL